MTKSEYRKLYELFNRRFDRMNERFDRIDRSFEASDGRYGPIEERFGAIARRVASREEPLPIGWESSEDLWDRIEEIAGGPNREPTENLFEKIQIIAEGGRPHLAGPAPSSTPNAAPALRARWSVNPDRGGPILPPAPYPAEP